MWSSTLWSCEVPVEKMCAELRSRSHLLRSRSHLLRTGSKLLRSEVQEPLRRSVQRAV
jgi:hypothetical protein